MSCGLRRKQRELCCAFWYMTAELADINGLQVWQSEIVIVNKYKSNLTAGNILAYSVIQNLSASVIKPILPVSY